MTLLEAGLDLWGADVVPDREGDWTFRVEGWSDPYAHLGARRRDQGRAPASTPS